MTITLFSKDYDHLDNEKACSKLWEDSGIYHFDPQGKGELFSIDTPPPYVSAAHLHVGHAMSYSQAEFVVRYKRMQGYRVFYPMGFDDNGLPTERYVEQTYKINKKKISRKEFRELCLKETRAGAKTYEELWRTLGLSVDWRLHYSTINDHCRKTSQTSFIDLFKKGDLYRSSDPVLWDTHFGTALAQADVETIDRRGMLHDVAFHSLEGDPLVISTTRPELIPACVALYCHPEDQRYQNLIGTKAVSPLFKHQVPILTSEEVKMDFGTGLMMVCTFGDAEDVQKWRTDKLETRQCLTPDGKLTELAGEFVGLTVPEGRSKIVKRLKEENLILKSVQVEQTVSVAERSGVPVEFIMEPQWFIRVLDKKEALLKRSQELHWCPEFMKVRLDHWIEGLKFDWNISRQRFYGVPFPVWFCTECHEAIIPTLEQLPVDPTEDPCPVEVCPKCGSNSFRGEEDVMDTWMTSSLTPQINANWANTADRLGESELFPMDLRVQGFEIIRTWLFYTLTKSHIHANSLPWRTVMISGWGLNEQGKKISKRDLEKFTDAKGFNRYEPSAVIEKYGADALRYWAAGSHLGQDLRFQEKAVRAGRKVVLKLWNAARFGQMQMEGFDPKKPRPEFSERTPEERWLLIHLQECVSKATKGFESYDFAVSREALEHFFWFFYCDNFLEIIKDRFWDLDSCSQEARNSTQATLYEAMRTILGLFAPFLPFVTEGLYQRIYAKEEGINSLHTTSFPKLREDIPANSEVPEMKYVLDILAATRTLRTKGQVSQNKRLKSLTVDLSGLDEKTRTKLQDMHGSLKAIARCKEVHFDTASHETNTPGIKVDIEFLTEEDEEKKE